MTAGSIRQLAVALVTAAVMTLPTFGHAQSIEDLTPGNDKAALWPLENPKETNTSAGYTTNRYRLPSEVEFSATIHNATNRIVSLEETWSGDGDGPSAGFSDFRFGRTTLAEIRSRTSSNGILYKDVMPVAAEQSGAINFSFAADVKLAAAIDLRVLPISVGVS